MLNIPAPIVSIEWLKENLENEKLLILDGTITKATDNSLNRRESVFIKGALLFDIKNVFSNVNAPFPNTMISVNSFQEKVRELGVNNDSCIVVYDQYGYYSCARVWWMFKSMGFENIAVLDGGLPYWIKSNYAIQKEPSKPFEIGNFKGNYIKNKIHNHEFVLKAISDNNKEIIDARAYNRFLGIEPEPRKGLRSGHIPSSKSMPYTSLLDNNKMKSKDQLIEFFKEYKNKDLIFSCGSGITACILALGAELVGIKNKSVYDGSWTEWGSLTKLPIEK